MTDFEEFINLNNLQKSKVAEYLSVSPAFITQLCNGTRSLPPEKYALIKANPEWDASMLKQESRKIIATAYGAGSNTASVNIGDNSEVAVLKMQVEMLTRQIDMLNKQNETLQAEKKFLYDMIDRLSK